MSWLVLHLPTGDVLLADELGENQYRREHGLTPYRDKDGKLMTKTPDDERFF